MIYLCACACVCVVFSGRCCGCAHIFFNVIVVIVMEVLLLSFKVEQMTLFVSLLHWRIASVSLPLRIVKKTVTATANYIEHSSDGFGCNFMCVRHKSMARIVHFILSIFIRPLFRRSDQRPSYIYHLKLEISRKIYGIRCAIAMAVVNKYISDQMFSMSCNHPTTRGKQVLEFRAASTENDSK